MAVKDSGTGDDPWVLTTPPGKSEFQAWRDETLEPPALVCQVGSTRLSYDLRCLDDLHAMLVADGPFDRKRRVNGCPPSFRARYLHASIARP